METVSPLPAQSEEPFKNVEFMHFLASLITSEVSVDRLNLDGEDKVWAFGVVPPQCDEPAAAQRGRLVARETAQLDRGPWTSCVCVRESEQAPFPLPSGPFIRVPTFLPDS